MNKRPKVLVFDLDYTLWPFYVEYHDPPFEKDLSGNVINSKGATVNHYPHITEILSDLHSQGFLLAIASRTSQIKGGLQLIDLFGWSKFLSHVEIFSEGKAKHLTIIKNFYQVEFNEMIFFDDEGRNIKDVSELGVFSILVHGGVTKKLVEEAIEDFATKKAKKVNVGLMETTKDAAVNTYKPKAKKQYKKTHRRTNTFRNAAKKTLSFLS